MNRQILVCRFQDGENPDEYIEDIINSATGKATKKYGGGGNRKRYEYFYEGDVVAKIGMTAIVSTCGKIEELDELPRDAYLYHGSNLRAVTIDEIRPTQHYVGTLKPIVCLLDLESYKEKLAKIIKVRNLEASMKARLEQMSFIERMQQLAGFDPMMRTMLDEYNQLNGLSLAAPSASADKGDAA